MNLISWLEMHAQRRPAKPAIIDRVSGLTLHYETFLKAAEAAAWLLAQKGVKAGDRVALWASSRPETFVLLFACARLGAILVPLNTRLSPRETETLLADCDPVLLLSDGTVGAPDGTQPLVTLAELLETPYGETSRAEGGSDPVAILYTGGTTGTPKGALLTHETVRANAHHTVTGWGLSSLDVTPVLTPLFHTGGLNVLATPLFSIGGTIVLTGPFEAAAVLDVIEEEGCTLLFMVPTMFQMLREAPSYHRRRLEGVRMVVSGGAPCPRPLADALQEDGLPFRQGYGLTEAGPNNFAVTADDARERPGTVGHPIPGIEIRLEDADGNLVLDGQPGEVVIRGPHVTPGYWRKVKETNAVLRDGGLHTGDLAVRDGDGFYYVCGRLKEMFISGGENVFPAEVEEVLMSHPDVAEAAVVGVPHEKWGEVGQAWLVARDGRGLEPQAIIDFCRTRLARYKTPREIRIVPSLPRSAAGKVLKHELR